MATPILPSIALKMEHGSQFRPTESLADLRNVAEILFAPMIGVGFWDGQTGEHTCPNRKRSEECAHQNVSDFGISLHFRETAGTELGARLEVIFPHAGVHIFLRGPKSF